MTTEGFQDYCWETQRGWKVVDPASLNHVGEPVAYKLVPGAAMPHMLPGRLAGAADRGGVAPTLWVTPYAPRSAGRAARSRTSRSATTACPAWIAAGRSIEDTDVVLWYVFGIHHITRMEDWPIMPVDAVSFWLKPFGFFDRNPALDVPPSPAHCEHDG